jgi:hypothetical protein
MRKSYVAVGLILGLILIFVGYRFFEPEDTTIEEKIISHQGYSTKLLSSSESVRFVFSKNWIPDKEGKTKELDMEIKQIGSSKIILDRIFRQAKSQDLHIYLSLKQDIENKNNGKIALMNENIRYEQWKVYIGEQQVPMGFGNGFYQEEAYIVLHYNELDKLVPEFEIQYSGLLLYEYLKD